MNIGGVKTSAYRPDLWLVPVFVVLLAIEPTASGLSSETASIDAVRWAQFAIVITIGLLTVTFHGFPRVAIEPPTGFLLGAACWMMLAALVSDNPLADMVIAIATATVIVMASAMVTRHGFTRVVHAAGLGIIIVVLIGCFVSAARSELRWSGLHGGFNGFGIHGAVIIAISVHAWLRSSSPLALLPLPIGLIAVIMSDSKVAIASVALAGIAFVRSRLPPLSALLITIVIVAVAFSSTVGSTVADRVAVSISRSGDSEEITTLTGRTDIWEVGIDAAVDSPTFGVGPTGVRDLYADALADGDIGFDAGEAHNGLLQIVLAAGVPAGALLLLGIGAAVVRVAQRPQPLQDGILAIVALHALTESLVREPRVMWFLLAAAVAATTPSGRPREPARPRQQAAAGR